MANYNSTDKFLHKLYLSNYLVSKTSLEIEESIFGKKAGDLEIKEKVFISGLARSGTTALMRKIFESGEYASLQYSNMPYILAPNLWNRSSSIRASVRAHNDGIKVDGNSPEEFDEYFWKVFLNDSYIKESYLEIHDVPKEILKKYELFISLVCLAKKKEKYISKNNNNILRLTSIKNIRGAKTIFLFRNPIDHASSLSKLHNKFTESQKKDSFELDYFNFLGHHEFGLGHKPLNFQKDKPSNNFNTGSIEYWLTVWINYHEFLLSQLNNVDLLIPYEKLVKQSKEVSDKLSEILSLKGILENDKKFIPPTYNPKIKSEAIKKNAFGLYNELLDASKKYF